MQRAIVFGGTGGIGQAICRDLAAAGWSLYVHCNDQWQLACELCENLTQHYSSQDFIPIKFDFLTNNENLSAFVKQLLPVNALVFAQGITDYQFVGKQKLATIDKLMQLNLQLPIKLTALFEPILVKQDYSRIVYLGSVYGKQGSALEAVYSATKAGLSGFAQAYAREVASAQLTVNVIAPGAVDTPMNAMFDPATMDEVQAEIPAGRLATGDDIAFWVTNLLDERSDYLTGQTIYVSGGWLV
ncbi:SDR family NAD(P)-dependent oxidoreductase [Lactobacillus sp. ESL0684]|uniref:elongation factor P 5-aminopentanone reductase n=1 Tax=unclassified Lactobacillus TaxID=2620435 RepID=UPI0023F73E12|nr:MULTISPECIES: SDR family oxidoreductase [unclassified Lactobacillus]WEV40423.1 SDR family NAD(P)-dependent oxidoreductase [Lactobacillus sp. ESL0681]WEV43127.1 SDR family NAD(P)-dependent oxidoreductase [Lactobacillus sp. ESL0684]